MNYYERLICCAGLAFAFKFSTVKLETLFFFFQGVPFYPHPNNDSPSGGIRVPMPTPGVPMPQYQSMGQQPDMQFAAMPPPPPNSNCVTPSAAQLPHLGRSAFMTTSPLMKEVPDENGSTLYPKGQSVLYELL